MKQEIEQLVVAWMRYLRNFFYSRRFCNERAAVRKKLVSMTTLVLLGLVCVISLTRGVAYGQEELTLGAFSQVPIAVKMFPITVGSSITAMLVHFARRRFAQFKRIFDLFLAGLALILFLPFLLVLAILIKLDSPGPAFFTQVRLGRKGRKFRMWKLRTMRHNAESETGPVWTAAEDPRITNLGRFIRKSHLDEVPQLINVLKGEMSLIGPRPERPEFSSSINVHVNRFDHRLAVKPGITGLAQVRYRYGASIKDAGKKLKYDLLYIQKMSLGLDFQILGWTVGKFLVDEGAR